MKFVEPLKDAPRKKYYQYTAIDDCTRLRVLRIYPHNNQLGLTLGRVERV